MVKFSFFTPNLINKSEHAIAEAPAPFTTTLILEIFFFVMWIELINAADVMIAVPCWSSWNIGISSIFFNSSSIIKHSGAAISSRLMPPKLTAKFFILLIISLGSLLSISKSIASISANLLNRTALPSITGFEAIAPKLPSPKIADPLLITATKFPLVV